MKILLLLLFALMMSTAVWAQESGSSGAANTEVKFPKQLHVLITRNKWVFLDPGYSFNTRDINAIYSLVDVKKAIAKFGEAGKEGVLLISAKVSYMTKFLKSIGIIYRPLEKGVYGEAGSQEYQ